MKGIIAMLSPSYLSSIYNITICILSVLLFSPNLYAQSGDVNYKVSAGLYNPKGDSGDLQEDFKNYLNLGAQYGLTDSFSISLDSYISDEVDSNLYFGVSLDYSYEVSNDYDVFARIGGDVMDNDIVPKVGFGIIANVSKNWGLTVESIMRNSSDYSEYLFAIGLSYKFGGTDESDIVIVGDTKYKPLTSIDDPYYSGNFKQENHESINKHMVVSGDTLWGISKRFNIELSLLIKMNSSIINPDLIYPDMRIILE